MACLLTACLLAASLLTPSAAAQPPSRRYVAVVSVPPEDGPGVRLEPFGATRDDWHWLRQATVSPEQVVALRVFPAAVRQSDRRSDAAVVGATANFATAAGIELVRGRSFTEQESDRAENVCVISERLASSLFGQADPIGRSVRLERSYYLVVGVCRPPRIVVSCLRDAGGGERMVVMPLRTMRSRLGDTVVLRRQGTFQASQYELSEIWVPGDEARVRQVLAAARDKDDPQSDLRVFPQLGY